MTPRVTIIIPTHNRAALVTGAIASAWGQSEPAIEVVVVDDGSTDDTGERLSAMRTDPRLRTIHLQHQGRSAARNAGAQMAEGQWLIFLDSDDRLLPGAVADHLSAAQPQTGATVGGYAYTNADGLSLAERRPWQESGLALADWLFNCLALPASTMIRRNWFEQVQGFDPALHMAEDWDLYLRLAQAGCPMAWTPAIVCQYQQHTGSSIHNLALHRDSSLRALDKVFRLAGPEAEIAARMPRAKAWVYVVFARRAFAAGQAESAAHDLFQALRLDPALAAERRPQLLEYLFSPEAIGQQAEVDMEAAVVPYLPEALTRRAADVRHAQARAHMAAFFRARGRGAPEQAQAHLRAALQRDGRWLFNRGVLAFYARRALRLRPHDTTQ